MIRILNVNKVDGSKGELCLLSEEDSYEIDGQGLLMLPAFIDPHVHFRIPGASHKEDWITGSYAALLGGVTTVFDMPNNTPNCTTLSAFKEKEVLIQKQLDQGGIPLRFHLYFGATKDNLKEIPKVKDHVIAIKVFMGSSTGDLLVDDDKTLEAIFKMAKDLDLLVALHAEDEKIISKNKLIYQNETDPSIHSKIRNREAAKAAVTKAIELTSKYGTRTSILHLSTEDEISLVKQAKKQGLPVFAEATPHHLFLTQESYKKFGNKVKVNPPLREDKDQEALWKGIQEGVIDYIGTDHAPHTLSEKSLNYKEAPAGIPSIELLLPLLLTAVDQGKIDLETLVKLTRTNIEKIFRLKEQTDFILVDLASSKKFKDEELKTKCQWSPYSDQMLKGRVAYVFIQNKLFHMDKLALCPS
ncbi:dihydroorotase [Criblamydia sequanensis]|uniref:Dihydroorotase n=1 Tax=Candidatus Criblamydia sequanensis CRIB-18 TaxID=1437425 RepID=A0A090D056_9BACT|nr:dihydroorotase family protein [Criblamydia sequanensis]CDR33180.1 Dihydroorotase [Criblamydia sequanensis CRIB-18]